MFRFNSAGTITDFPAGGSAGATVLFSENWENYQNTEPTYEDYAWTNGIFGGGLSSSNKTGSAIDYTYTAVAGDTSYLCLNDVDNNLAGGHDARDTNWFRAEWANTDADAGLYCQWKVRFSDNYQFDTNNSKHFYFPDITGEWQAAIYISAYQASQTAGVYGDLFGSGYTDDRSKGRIHFHLYSDINNLARYPDLTNSWPDAGAWYLSVYGDDLRYMPNCLSGVKTDHRLSATELESQGFVLEAGGTYTIEVYVKPGATGTGNGAELRMWINGVLAIEYVDNPAASWSNGPTDADRADNFFDRVSLRKIANSQPNTKIWVSGYQGFSGDPPTAGTLQWCLYDDIVVSDSYIGV